MHSFVGRRNAIMSDPIHKAIWYLRVKRGLYISRKAEQYATEELEEDLFPYGFDDGSDEVVFESVRWSCDQLLVLAALGLPSVHEPSVFIG
jgi:hypothetical protein